MLKTVSKSLLLIALPLGLAVGCASNRPQTQAFYSSDPSTTLAPTSARADQRIYSESASGAPVANVGQPPAGASPANWAIAEEIRQRLISDETLAPLGSSLIAKVSNDGVVTLSGNVGPASEQQRVCDTIAGLPGVRGVKNNLNGGRDSGTGSLHMQGTEPGDY